MKKDTIKTVTTTGLLMCVLGAIFYYYEYYLRVAPSVMSTELKLAFNLNEAAFGYLAAFYYYAYTPMQIPVGLMLDRIGPRRILTGACFLSAFATYLFAVTTLLPLALLGRFLVGLGAAFGYVGVLKLSNLWLPQKYFAFVAGITSTLGMFGGISGKVVMTNLVEGVGWQWTLFYSASVGVLLSILLWIILRDKKDIRGAQFAGAGESLQPKFEGLKEIVLSREMWIVGLIGCFTFLPISGFAEVWDVSFLTGIGFSKQQAAVGSSMLFLGFAVGAPLWGIVSDFIQSRRLPLILGSFISAIFMALVIFVPNLSVVSMYSFLFLSTFFAGAEILIFAVSNDLSRPTVSATAVAFTNMVVMIGGVLLPPIVGEILDRSAHIVDNMPIHTVQDYALALTMLPVSLALAGILSYCIKETYPRRRVTHVTSH